MNQQMLRKICKMINLMIHCKIFNSVPIMMFKYVIGIAICMYFNSFAYSQTVSSIFTEKPARLMTNRAAVRAIKKIERNQKRLHNTLNQLYLDENSMKDTILKPVADSKTDCKRLKDIIANSTNNKLTLSRKQEKGVYYSLQKINYGMAELKKASLPSVQELNRKKNEDLKLAQEFRTQKPGALIRSNQTNELENKQTKSQVSSIIYQRTGKKQSDQIQLKKLEEGSAIVNKYKVMFPALETFNWVPSFKPNLLRGLPLKERLKFRILLSPNLNFDGSQTFSPGIQFDYSLSKRYYWTIGFNPTIHGPLKDFKLNTLDFHSRSALGLNLSSIFALELGIENSYLSRNNFKSDESDLKQPNVLTQPFLGIVINYGKLFKIPGSIFIGYKVNECSTRAFKKEFVQFRILF
jgi:hypothetical protein